MSATDIDIAQQALFHTSRGSGTTQSDDEIPITEFSESREMTLDFQKGVVVHVYDVPGNTTEALADARMGGMKPGSIHPNAGQEGGTFDNHFLTKQTYKHLRMSDDVTKRKTRVTSVYEQRPCFGLFEQEIRTTLRAVPEWYEREEPFRVITRTFTPVSLPTPRAVVVRRYRNVSLSTSALLNIIAHVGYTNRQGFWGGDIRAWLFEGIHARMLYGKPIGDGVPEYQNANWEITTFFEYDPIRSHQMWDAKVGENTLPVDWEDAGKPERKDLHERYTVFPVLPKGKFDDGDFRYIITDGVDPAKCMVTE